ncbi:hypothetical protein FBU59_001733 [Linderina macrospora]|uniref:Uncharacterized protein n=1 Tax=Linderina macrospora TaxID=4868 RepID=A0ACC1JDD4_9FUNG|nr:hypothetical protein FBU59_001733 [Linderina macrospora]
MAARIEQYFSTVRRSDTATTPAAAAHTEISLARHILQSCNIFFGELERIKLGVHGECARALCQSEWAVAETHVDRLLHELCTTEQSTQTCPDIQQLVDASQATIGSLRACIRTLVARTELRDTNEYVLRTAAMALHTVAMEIRLAHDELHTLKSASRPMGDRAPHKPDSDRPMVHASADQLPPNALDAADNGAVVDHGSDDDLLVSNAVREASALASLLRIFTRVSQHSWVSNRSHLAHAPSVPSPLSSGASTLQHRRWVSEDIETESNTTPGLRISVNGSRRTSATAASHATTAPLSTISVHSITEAPPSHLRNQSDSQLQISTSSNGSPNLYATPPPLVQHKSALSMRWSSRQPSIGGGTPTLAGSEPAERSKQVRFTTAGQSAGDQAIDQGSLQELMQALPKLEQAIVDLETAVGDASLDRAPAAKSLVTAFAQISKISSRTGMVKHYDKNILRCLKATMQAVKTLMPLISSTKEQAAASREPK